MKTIKRSPALVHFLLGSVLAVGLAACGGGNPGTTTPTATGDPGTTAPTATGDPGTTPPAATYTIGGTVSGLASGTSVTLSDTRNYDSVTLSDNSTFVFPKALASGTYAVIVGTQPTNQTCAVANYQGSVSNANVTNIDVTCSTNTYALTGTVSNLASGQSLTVLVNGNALAAPVTASGNFSLGSVTGGSSYAVTLQSGWYYNTGTSTGTYCYVQNGSGTANANVSNINIACGNPPNRIDLSTSPTTATQNGVSYAGWSLINPIVVNGDLYYEAIANATTLSMTMTELEALFDGSGSSQMGAAGDPSSPQANVGNCTPACGSNMTTLQTNSMGMVAVAVPTLAQLRNIFGSSPTWDGSNYFWSSTISTAYSPSVINGHIALQSNGDSYVSSNVWDGATSNYVAFQVQ